ncbi:MAG: hypothetical protein AMXMBFR84_20190 [Candidatus Hydrogenedentota bacterium]
MKKFLRLLGLKQSDDRDPEADKLTIHVRSTVDGSKQPCLWKESLRREAAPLLVYLHPWRHGYDTDSRRWRAEAINRQWHFIAPHFRGPNKHADACASDIAKQDVLDAVDYACKFAKVDERRIYLAGVSGGAHMALMMAAHAPVRWAAVSAWCAPTDLVRWYQECVDAGSKVYRHLEKIAGGKPEGSNAAAEELKKRSPLFHIANANAIPLDISHGIRDGQPKGIGVHHAIFAFNALAEDQGLPVVSKAERDLLAKCEFLSTQEEQDNTYGRTIYLRRYANKARITIFEGGHEDLPAAGTQWLERH